MIEMYSLFKRKKGTESGSIGAFTISVCKFYVLNMRRKQRGRDRIEERLATLMDTFK